MIHRPLQLRIGHRLLLFAVSLLVWIPGALQGAAPAVLTDNTDSLPLNGYVEYFEDSESRLTIEEVASPDFRLHFMEHPHERLNFGYTSSTFWLRLAVRDTSTAHRDWLLEVDYPHLDHVTLFLPDGKGGFQEKTTGDLHPFSQREIPHASFLFRLPLENQGKTVFLRVESESSMQLPLVLYDADAFFEADRRFQYCIGIYYGIMLAMFCYNLFLFISFRDTNYLLYLFHLLGFAFFQANLNGISVMFFWPDSPIWGNRALLLSVCFALFWAAFFSKSFLGTASILPWINRIHNLMLIALLVMTVPVFLLSYAFTVRTLNVMTLLMVLMILVSSVLAYRKGYRPARFLLIAWSFFLLGILLNVLWGFGLLPTLFLTRYGLQVGSALEVILLSLALADRVLASREAYENALRTIVADRTEQLRGKSEALNDEISAHRKTEQSFRESEEKYRILVENTKMAIGISKGEQVFFANRALLDLLGYESLEDLQKESMLRLVTPELRPALRERARLRNAGLPTVDELENRMLRKDGSVITVEQVSTNIWVDNETYVLSTFKDISDRKKTEEALRDAREKAEEASRLKSEFLANISHEIRTPMQAIIGYANLAIGRFKETRKNKLLEYFEEISLSSKRLLVLLNDLLDLSKMESGRMEYRFEQENLSFLIQFVLRELRPLLDDKGLQVDFREPEIDDQLVMDREKIMQVIHNLLSNAVKFSPDNGSIHLELSETIDFLVFSVRDEGIGIPRRELEYIFDKFTQSSNTKTGAGGTGLGLAICREIIKAHGGEIWAVNQKDGGAVFTFTLPRDSVPQPAVDQRQAK